MGGEKQVYSRLTFDVSFDEGDQGREDYKESHHLSEGPRVATLFVESWTHPQIKCAPNKTDDQPPHLDLSA